MWDKIFHIWLKSTLWWSVNDDTSSVALARAGRICWRFNEIPDLATGLGDLLFFANGGETGCDLRSGQQQLTAGCAIEPTRGVMRFRGSFAPAAVAEVDSRTLEIEQELFLVSHQPELARGIGELPELRNESA